MDASARAKDFSTGEHHFQPDNVITGDAILETAWSTRVGRNVSANAALVQARRIGRIK